MGAVSAKRSSIKVFNKYNSALVGNPFTSPYTPNFELIGTTILSTAQATVTIDVSTLAAQGFKHLQLRTFAKSATDSNANILARFNGDTTTMYSFHSMYTTGSSIVPTGLANMAYVEAGFVGSNYGCSIAEVVDMFSSSKYKTIRHLTGSMGSFPLVQLGSGVWRNTATVTSMGLYLSDGASFSANSRFSIYGLRG